MASPRFILLPLLVMAISTGLPANAQQAEEPPLWTTEPTRVDRAKQHFERLPAVPVNRDTRTWLLVPPRIKVLDSVTFTVGEQLYQIAHVRPVKPKRLCQAIEGGRWACGRMASIFLGNLVRGKRLRCDMTPVGNRIMLTNCVIGTRGVAEAIVTQGYGKAIDDGRLLAAETEARKAASQGLWRNPRCAIDFDNC